MGPRVVSVHLKDYVLQKVEAGYLMRGAVLGEGRLGMDRYLRLIHELAPEATLILEMTIRRNEKARQAQIIAWEKESIATSLRNLRETLSSINGG
jgi:L-ribulose-5-phosphate 3-epimerase UlaE